MIVPNLLIVRTDYVTPELLEVADLVAGRIGHQNVCFAVDEENNLPSGYECIHLTPESYVSVGLYCPADFRFLCRDYAFYLAALRHPNSHKIVLIDGAVALSYADPAGLVEALTRHEADFIASGIKSPQEESPWRISLARQYPEPRRECSLTVSALSRRSTDHLFERRRYSSRIWELASERLTSEWLPGEAYVVNELARVWHTVSDIDLVLERA